MKRLTGWGYIAGVKTGDILNGVHEQVAFDRLARIEDILGDEYDLDRLKELVEADKDGRCVVLPCKIGDICYWIVDKGIYECYFDLSAANYIGKSVFFTREAAEAALKAKARGDKH